MLFRSIERPGAVADSDSLKCLMTTKPRRQSKVWTARTTTAAGSQSMKHAQEPPAAELVAEKVAIEVPVVAIVAEAVVIEVVAATVVTIDPD